MPEGLIQAFAKMDSMRNFTWQGGKRAEGEGLVVLEFVLVLIGT